MSESKHSKIADAIMDGGEENEFEAWGIAEDLLEGCNEVAETTE